MIQNTEPLQVAVDSVNNLMAIDQAGTGWFITPATMKITRVQRVSGTHDVQFEGTGKLEFSLVSGTP